MEVRIVLLMWYHARLQSFYANRSVAFRPLLRHVPQQQVKKNERSKKIWENYYKAAQKKTLRDVFVFFFTVGKLRNFFSLITKRGISFNRDDARRFGRFFDLSENQLEECALNEFALPREFATVSV